MRKAEINRKTRETDIIVSLNLDGNGENSIDTGIPFFDHMLNIFSKHSSFNLIIKSKGDLNVDYHHTIEDMGIVLGTAFKNALNDKMGITRFADSTVPLDEALSRVVVDISGRPYLSYNVKIERTDDGSNVNPDLFEEFFRSFANHSQINLHIDLIRGNNSHHIIESVFKSFAKALKKAVKIEGDELPSTKGLL